jgi:molybdopterin-guanine dinucleotide biosynthesis protein A
MGLVLAGGLSLRMGRDKGSLEFQGASLIDRAVAALQAFAEPVRVSVRRLQAAEAPYRRYTPLIDSDGVAGPAAGLLAAWEVHPAAALLVLAVDMPRVDRATLSRLVEGRAPGRLATAFRHPDGTPEPLCAVWEPRAAAAVRAAVVPGTAAPSLRRIQQSGDVAWLDPPDPSRLVSLNTPEALAAALLQESGATP